MIVIEYPPDFDGELHINEKQVDHGFTFSFTHAAVNNSAWETLVKAAEGILAQNTRKRKKV